MEVELFLANCRCYLLLGPTREGCDSREENMCDDAQRPDIDLGVVRLLKKQLWRHIQRSAETQRELLLRINSLGKAKVSDFANHGCVLVVEPLELNHDVVELEVSVDHILLVQKVDCQDNLMNDIGTVSLRERSARFLNSPQILLQIAMSHQLKHYVNVLCIFAKIQHSYDVWVFVLIECLKFGPH